MRNLKGHELDYLYAHIVLVLWALVIGHFIVPLG